MYRRHLSLYRRHLSLFAHLRESQSISLISINQRFFSLLKQDEEGPLGPKQKRAMLVTKLGAGVNVFLAGCKGYLNVLKLLTQLKYFFPQQGFVGISVGSTALISDACNSAGDVVCDAVVYTALVQSRQAATPERPWGRGKLEPLGTLTVGGLLLLTGLGVGYTGLISALQMLSEIYDLHSLVSQLGVPESVSHHLGLALETEPPLIGSVESTGYMTMIGNEAAIGVSLLSIACKEMLFHYTLKAGQAADSSTVIANAWLVFDLNVANHPIYSSILFSKFVLFFYTQLYHHLNPSRQHRADSFVSGAVLAGVSGSMMGYPLLDPVAGILVSGLIFKQGVKTTIESLRDLSDAPADSKETAALVTTCLAVPVK